MKNLLKGLFVVIAAIAILLKYGEMRRAKNREYVETYPKAVEEHLESKYGKKFIVNPKYFVDSGSPVPFSSMYAPYEFKVSEDGEDGYDFYVYIYPESIKNKKIKEVRDGYYWKYIKEETKEYIVQEMGELFPKEYKLIFITSLRTTCFNDNFRSGIPMERYFKTAKYKELIRLYVITPPEGKTEISKFTQNSVYPILYNFYIKNYCNIEIKFYFNQTETYDDYENIDVKEFERSIYYNDTKDVDDLWGLLAEEDKIIIEIK